LIVLVVVALFAYRATRTGFLTMLVSLIGFALALLLAFTFYAQLGDWLSRQFGWDTVWSRPIAFVGLWSIVGLLFGVVERLILTRLSYEVHTSPTNRALAVFPGVLQGLLVAAVILTMLSLIPVPAQADMRRDIMAAPVASRLVTTTLAAQRPFEEIFGPAARQALSLIPRRPPTTPGQPTDPNEKVDLQFTVDDAETDPVTEEAMLALVNRERTSNGLQPLVMDTALRELARSYADQMFKRGYFAHNTPEGVDPFERMRQANIQFGLAGENLALAPTLDQAHTGLMNSPGHRANILRDGFRKVGIGVMDGGIHGKMFVQEFTD
jgi:uncharacterized protein YkwD